MRLSTRVTFAMPDFDRLKCIQAIHRAEVPGLHRFWSSSIMRAASGALVAVHFFHAESIAEPTPGRRSTTPIASSSKHRSRGFRISSAGKSLEPSRGG